MEPVGVAELGVVPPWQRRQQHAPVFRKVRNDLFVIILLKVKALALMEAASPDFSSGIKRTAGLASKNSEGS